MFENIENLKLVSSSEGVSKKEGSVSCRKYHTFIIRTSGKVTYYFDGKFIDVNEGEMIFLPQGCAYEFKSEEGKVCKYVAISFSADIESAEYAVCSVDDIPEAEYICKNFPALWKVGGATEKLKCYALLYNLLSRVSETDKLSYADTKKFSLIEPAVEHLRNHMFDVSLKVDELHNLCGISDTYFRKIFITRFGTSPQKYIVNKRISHARAVIDSGECMRISEAAFLVGYSDPLYFSKVFKKKYGLSPSDLLKEV